MFVITTEQKLIAWICDDYHLSRKTAYELIKKYLSKNSYCSNLLILAILNQNYLALKTLLEFGHPLRGAYFTSNIKLNGKSFNAYSFGEKHPLTVIGMIAETIPKEAITMLRILASTNLKLDATQKGKNEKWVPTLSSIISFRPPDVAEFGTRNANLAEYFTELVNLGADPNYQDEKGDTCLHTVTDSKILINAALKHGTNPRIKNLNGETAGEHSRVVSAISGQLHHSDTLP
jgi:hypothetical protein